MVRVNKTSARHIIIAMTKVGSMQLEPAKNIHFGVLSPHLLVVLQTSLLSVILKYKFNLLGCYTIEIEIVIYVIQVISYLPKPRNVNT